MIALTKSGYKKFIEGTLHIPTDTKVAVLATGLDNNTFTTSNVNAKRLAANTNLPEYPFEDFSASYSGDSYNSLFIKGMVNIDTMDFVTDGDVPVAKQAAVIDTTDADDVIGMIFLYPDASPITYSALNSAPVNIDYRGEGMSKIQFKTSSASYSSQYRIQGSSTIYRNYTDIFPLSLTKLPIFDNTVTSNMLTDLKIALLSSTYGSETQFRAQIFNDSKTMSSLYSMANSSTYNYVSGGFAFRNLGIGSTYACLTANDTTIYIPGLTENNNTFFAVVYFEDTSKAGNDVMSDTYKQNSYILSTIHDINETQLEDIRFPFKQSVIIDSLFLSGLSMLNPGIQQSGILALNNVVGPGFTNGNLNDDF